MIDDSLELALNTWRGLPVHVTATTTDPPTRAYGDLRAVHNLGAVSRVLVGSGYVDVPRNDIAAEVFKPDVAPKWDHGQMVEGPRRLELTLRTGASITIDAEVPAVKPRARGAAAA